MHSWVIQLATIIVIDMTLQVLGLLTVFLENLALVWCNTFNPTGPDLAPDCKETFPAGDGVRADNGTLYSRRASGQFVHCNTCQSCKRLYMSLTDRNFQLDSLLRLEIESFILWRSTIAIDQLQFMFFGCPIEQGLSNICKRSSLVANCNYRFRSKHSNKQKPREWDLELKIDFLPGNELPPIQKLVDGLEAVHYQVRSLS